MTSDLYQCPAHSMSENPRQRATVEYAAPVGGGGDPFIEHDGGSVFSQRMPAVGSGQSGSPRFNPTVT